MRIARRPKGWQRNPEHQALRKKVEAGEASAAEAARFRALHQSEALRVLEIEPDQLFKTEEIHEPAPGMARIHASIPCARCGEGVMETRVRRYEGNELCLPCFEQALAR